MLVNPEIQDYLDRLQGRPQRGGFSPGRAVAATPNYAGQALAGIIKPEVGASFGFRAPESRIPRFEPRPPAPYAPERPAPAQVVPPIGGGRGAGSLGGEYKAAGLKQLGQGIEQFMNDLAAKRAADAKADADRAANSPRSTFGHPPAPKTFGTNPDKEAAKPPPPPSPYPGAAPITTPAIGPAGGPNPLIGQGLEIHGPAPMTIGPMSPTLPLMASTGGTGGSNTLAASREAIAAIESRGSGDYGAIGKVTRTGDRAYGRYQVMGANIPAWTKAALGKEMTPQEFLADKDAQDAVFNHQFGAQLDAGHSPQEAANWWFTGKYAPPATAHDINRTTAPQYLDRFNREYAAAGGKPASSSVSLPPEGTAIADINPTQPRVASGAQTVIPGQGDPHKPGFDPGSVPFINTPIAGGPAAPPPAPQPVAAAPSVAAPIEGTAIADINKPQPTVAAAPQPSTVAAAPPPASAAPAPPGGMGPYSRDQTAAAGLDFNIPGPSRAASVPVPAPPGQQSMNVPPNRQDMLADTLARNQPQAPPAIDPAMLALALQGGGAPDFGGGFLG
jgi:hypothetical protein